MECCMTAAWGAACCSSSSLWELQDLLHSCSQGLLQLQQQQPLEAAGPAALLHTEHPTAAAAAAFGSFMECCTPAYPGLSSCISRGFWKHYGCF